MSNFIRGYCERAAAEAQQPGTPIRFVASTEKVGRDGLVIDSRGWQLDNFLASPSILWSHDYSGSRPPIGKAERVWVEDNQLMVDITFDQEDDFAKSIESKYRRGIISAVSVGWESLEIEPARSGGNARVVKAELLDVSAVNVPGDPHALIQRQMRALRDVLDATTETDPPATPPASETWERTAAAMVDLYAPYSPRPDDERKAEHIRLAREYSRLDKTPPEFMPAADLDAFDGDTIRGLFLEGEPEMLPRSFAVMDYRAGAVLSKRNLDDLQAISDLALGILARSVKEAETADTPPAEPDDSARTLLLELKRLKGN